MLYETAVAVLVVVIYRWHPKVHPNLILHNGKGRSVYKLYYIILV